MTQAFKIANPHTTKLSITNTLNHVILQKLSRIFINAIKYKMIHSHMFFLSGSLLKFIQYVNIMSVNSNLQGIL